MKNMFLKRILCLLLTAVLLLGYLPASVRAETDTDSGSADVINSADSASPVGMTVSVSNSMVTITINRVGTTGTATLYRVAADGYATGDSLTGMSANVNAAGTAIGTYTCGTTQSFNINRYLSDGSDNLYDKYYLIQGDTILVGPVYATQINSLRNKEAFAHDNKKGLTMEDSNTINDAVEMGVTNTVININLAELLVATEDEFGEPRDLSRRNDLISYQCNGKTYYFKNDYIKLQDGLISAYSKAGINVTLVIISWAKTLTDDYPRALMYFEQTDRQTLAFNTSNERGMEYWVAAMEFLADRYSKSVNMGLVQKFIVGNEIDYTYDWYLLKPLYGSDGLPQRVDFPVFMEEFARTLRLANLAVKKYNSSARVLVSLTHNWAENCYDSYNTTSRSSVRWNSYAPKDIVDWLVEHEGARGDYNWGLAVHPYAVGTTPSNPLKTDVAGSYGKPVTGDPDTTPWITVANLEVYQLYLQRPENMYNGTELRTVSLTETTVLSKKSTDSGYETSIREQAASIAQTYYRAANIPCIDQIAYFQLHDQTTTSYMVGLMTSDGVKKPAYDVWKYIDTDKSFLYANRYLDDISSTATSYKDLMPAVKSDFNWDAMWDESNMIFRTVEGGSEERSLVTNKSEYRSDDLILVTATGDVGDMVELYLASDDIATAKPLYSYPVVGSQNGLNFRSGGTYDLIAYGEINTSRLSAAMLKAGDYVVVLRSGTDDQILTKNIKIRADFSMGTTEHALLTDKTIYTSGEDIIVYANGNNKCWAGLYRAGDNYVKGAVPSIYWYYVNEASSGQVSGKPTVLQTKHHNTGSSNPNRILAPGEYVLYLFDGSNGDEYSPVMSVALTVTAAEVQPLTSISFSLENGTDGFANGVVTVTKDPSATTTTECVMYWADGNGEPLEQYTSLAAFPLSGNRTAYQMHTHTIIPEGARKLLAYGSDGHAMSDTAVSVDLPENCSYVFNGEPLAEFQIVSDIHITTEAGATNEAEHSNQHFTMLLEDVMVNSPESIGIFVNGDIANTGKSAEYTQLLSLYYDALDSGLGNLPQLHLAIGNHDWMDGNPSMQFQRYAALVNSDLISQPQNVYYTELVGGYNFIYLGGEEPGLRAVLSDKQITWFDNLMAEITAKDPDKPVFVLLHQAFYNTVAGSLPGQGWDGVASEDALKAVLKKYGQIIMVNGHSHWEMNSSSNLYAGDPELPVALNTASVSYLWTSADVMSGQYLYGTQGYYVRVYSDKVVFLGRDFENGKFIPSACYVLRRNEVTGVEETYNVSVNQSAMNLRASSLSGDSVSYASSDNDIASVTDDGTVIAKQPGTVKVTITTQSTNNSVIAKKTVTVNVSPDSSSYTVTFRDWDGTLIAEGSYGYGDTVQLPEDPSRAATDLCSYSFAGWDPAPAANCAGNAVYTATYDSDYHNVVRVLGSDRFDTAFRTADLLKELGSIQKFRTIVVASGMDFADALSGSYLANRKNAPILLTSTRDQEVRKVVEYIRSNLIPGGTVYLLGGRNAVPASLEGSLNGFRVKRLAGDNRFETNLAILKEAGVEDRDVLICTGRGFADGLSASAVNRPVLLVDKALTDSQKAFLQSLGGDNKLYIIGGTGAVNSEIEAALAGYGPTERIEGENRFVTSVNIARKFFPDADTAVLAYAYNFPDGLSGGALAFSLDAPLLLTMTGQEAAAVEYVGQEEMNCGAVLGGTGLIGDDTARSIFRMEAGESLLVK